MDPWALDGFRGLVSMYRLGELCWGSLARIDKGHFSIPNPLIHGSNIAVADLENLKGGGNAVN